MFSNWQTPVAIAAVVIAVALLLRGIFVKRNKPGCGGGCGCPPNDFKARLKKAR